jgi:dTDP-L-rhamnose 4-epimerase
VFWFVRICDTSSVEIVVGRQWFATTAVADWMTGRVVGVKVLLTGSAGFIGTAIGAALEDEGHEVVRIDLMLPMAHGSSEVPAGTHQLDVRRADEWSDLLGGVDAVCHQAAVVGAGVRVGDLPDYASHNDLGTAALLAAMHERGVRRLVLASSMVVYGEGRYTCPAHGDQTPPPRARQALDDGDFENHCPVCGDALGWSLVDEAARLDPRSSYAASKVAQEHYASAWVRQADASAVALRYHNVYGPGMPRDTPYSGVAAMFRSSLERGEAPQVYEDGGQVRDFVHVADVARANVAALESVVASSAGRYDAYNVASGEPVSILRVAQMVGAGTGITPEVTGGYRLGDVRHIVASSEQARAELGFAASVRPADGLREFATAPLRA